VASVRVLAIDAVVPGTPLGMAVLNERGDVLLQAGLTLDEGRLAHLRERGHRALVVEDRQTAGIEMVDAVSAETRARAARAVQGAFAAGQAVADALGPEAAGSIATLPDTAEVRHLIAQGVDADAVLGAVQAIVDEVLDGPTMLGLNSIKSRDTYAFAHAVDVAAAAVLLGRMLHAPEPDLRRLARGALLHDIGQSFTGDHVDGKTGPIGPADVEAMVRHTQLGFDFLRHVPGFEPLSNHVAYQHHEWHGGGGYPRGLRGTRWGHLKREEVPSGEIIAIAQMTSVADVYDALCSERPFRGPMPRELAMSLIGRMAGKQLSSEMVERFLRFTPVFPPGYPVRALAGNLKGWEGVVASVGGADINRPIVRFFIRPDGDEVEPFEVDLSKDTTLRLATPSPRRPRPG
jgi:HD-GYP domain-containing protein (c-di-GMP phosphodiesterase class II)